MRAEEKISVKIRRLTPPADRGACYQVYRVPLVRGSSVMDVLDYIYEELDGTLAYYSHEACSRGVCGRCMMIINGKAGLACQTLVRGDLTLEPPPNLRVVKDLVHSKP